MHRDYQNRRGALAQRESCFLVTMRSWVQVLETASCRNAGKDIRLKMLEPSLDPAQAGVA
jgi:hypothetical protein